MRDLKQGQVARAYKRITSALQSHSAALGEAHPYTARSHTRLGRCWQCKAKAMKR